MIDPHSPAVERAPNSFLGVKFGQSMLSVQRRFPSGIEETSPYGLRVYRLNNVTHGRVTYKHVIYEFLPDQGMQFVLAEFNPSAASTILGELKRMLGPPERLGTNNQSPAGDAVWRSSQGVMIQYQGSRGRFVLFGPKGASLRPELKLRDEASVESRSSVPRPEAPA